MSMAQMDGNTILSLTEHHMLLIWCYKIIFECANVKLAEPFSFTWNRYTTTRMRGHRYKFNKPYM